MVGLPLLDSLLKDKTINWREFPYQSYAGHLPVPVIKKDSEIYGLVQRQKAITEERLKPIVRRDLAGLLYQLQGHYWQPHITEASARAVAQDYIRLLGEYPFDIYQKVYDEWLVNPANKYFPKVGELKELLDIRLNKRKRRLEQLIKLIERAE